MVAAVCAVYEWLECWILRPAHGIVAAVERVRVMRMRMRVRAEQATDKDRGLR